MITNNGMWCAIALFAFSLFLLATAQVDPEPIRKLNEARKAAIKQ